MKLDFYVPPAGTTPLNFTTSSTLATGVGKINANAGMTQDSLVG